ncbi:hypothetical protein TNCV_1649901 [Trichonephila clavipes]|nr:hypothetical protein TNCV_1649901 [Trichonephila clavipes]
MYGCRFVSLSTFLTILIFVANKLNFVPKSDPIKNNVVVSDAFSAFCSGIFLVLLQAVEITLLLVSNTVGPLYNEVAQVSSSSLDHGSKLRDPSTKALECDVNIHSYTLPMYCFGPFFPLRGLRYPSGQGIGAWQACHEFKPSTTKDPPCRAAMHVKSVKS